MSTRSLSTVEWIAGGLFLLAALGLQLWKMFDPGLCENLTVFPVTFAFAGSLFIALGRAYHRVARLEDRVQELERQREPAGGVIG